MKKALTYKTLDDRKLTLSFDKVNTIIDGITVSLNGMPLLLDEENNIFYFTQLTDVVTKMLVEIAKKKGLSVINEISPPASIRDERYNDFCPLVNFEYSAIEYLSIPGLATPMSNRGFLVPVYFNSEVLNKYAQNPKYTLDIFSATYGNIWFEERHISFGVNSKKQVIMWLGDIDSLALKEQQYLLSENIPSSFDIHSDFYDAQIENRWSEGAIENRCLNLRSVFSEKIKELYGVEFYKLPKEISKTIGDLQKPIFWEERHVAPIIESLNRIFVESISETFLKDFLKSRGVKLEDNWRTLKLMEKFIEHFSDLQKAREIMSPFFVLYDYRVNVCHLQSESTVTTKMGLINQRLLLDGSNASHEIIYDQLFKKVHDSLVEINKLIAGSIPTCSL